MRDSERKYTITKPLGRGGMGQVWAALKDGAGGMQMPCAIKVLWPALAMTEEDRERFYGEARIAAQLDHGRIVKVIDTTMVQGSPSLIMEWVDGVNLRVLVEKARAEDTPRLGVNVSLYVVGEILAALAYAHGRTVAGENAAVIHSDVTPGNILVSSSGEVKLTDFGIARFVKTSGQTMSRAVGTPRYMAPEQMRGRIYTATDIYGLGVVLHELLEGERFWADTSPDEFQFKVLGGHVPPLTQPDIPAWADTLRRRMLSVDPDERPTAEDAHAMIVEMADNHALAALELKRLYLRCVGKPSSGFTELLKLRHGGNEDLFFASVFGQDSGATPGEADAASDPPTRADAPLVTEAADPDAPAVLRRGGRTPWPGSRPETIERTNTGAAGWSEDDEQTVDPTIRLPAVLTVDDAPPARPATHLPDVPEEPAESADPGTRPFEPAFLQHATPTPLESDVTPVPVGVPVAAAASEEQRTPTDTDMVAPDDSTEDSAAVPEAAQGVTRTRYIAVAAGAAAFLFAGVFLASVVMTLTDEPTAVGTPVAAAEVEVRSADEVELAAEIEAKPAPDPQAEAPELAAPIVPPRPTAEVLPAAVVEDEVEEAEQAPTEAKPKPDPKPKPKPKLEPAVTVGFVILDAAPGDSKLAQIKAGSRTVTTDNKFKSTKLRPNSYPIQWRWGKDGPWVQAGSLRVEAQLPTGSYYTVKLRADKMEVSKTVKKGGAK